MKPITKFWVGVITLCCLAATNPVQAQIASDGTLSTKVKSRDNLNFTITGGKRAGSNLFHSFSEFDVLENGSAFFDNASGIENIISRVTGGSVSDIDGKLKANGTANLFLLNPNGVIFGPNASLDIGGSFVATTANAIQFGNQGFFSASARNVSPLLTVNPSAFLFNQMAAQPINPIEHEGSLSVLQDQSLLLVGGNVNLKGGVLSAPGGRVELGGVREPGTVELNGSGSNLSLSFPDQVARADVSLSEGAGVGVAARGGGSIAINAENIDISDGSLLRAGIASGLKASREAGDITLNATGTIMTGGSRSFISNIVDSKAKGNAGDINITTGTLQMNNAALSTDTSGQGKAGNISVRASGSVSLEDSSISSTVNSEAIGNAGDISIRTGSLQLKRGSLDRRASLLSSSTKGQGNAGNVTIKADTVSLTRGIVSSGVVAGAVGDGGDISITTTGSLSLTETAELLASTNGNGNAGNVTIEADTISLDRRSIVGSRVGAGAVGDGGDTSITTTGSLSLTKRGRIVADIEGQGKAGSVTINAETVSLEGGIQDRKGDFKPSGIFATVGENAVGDGGDIKITTGSLTATNGARINTNTIGQGNAGNVTINARNQVSLEGVGQNRGGGLISSGIFSNVNAEEANGSGGNITLDTTKLSVIDGAEILAKAFLGDGGNITLQVQELLQLRRGSSISTTAGTKQTEGDAGSIKINAPLIFAGPSENSDIIANAFTGNGGSVDITTQGIFGIEPREVQKPRQNQTSDITVSSELGVSGTVNLNALVTDPSQGLITLPEEVTDASNLIAQGCSASGGTASKEESRFVVTGRGGLPPNPNEPLSSDTVLADWVTIDPKIEETPRSDPAPSVSQTSSTPAPMEAQGWVRSSGGQVILTAQAPTVTPHSPGPTLTSCRGS